VPRGQRDGSLRTCSRLSRLEPLLFLSSSSSIVLTRLSGPRSRVWFSLDNDIFQMLPCVLFEVVLLSDYLGSRDRRITCLSPMGLLYHCF
jgi:hypothetical protein